MSAANSDLHLNPVGLVFAVVEGGDEAKFSENGNYGFAISLSVYVSGEVFVDATLSEAVAQGLFSTDKAAFPALSYRARGESVNE